MTHHSGAPPEAPVREKRDIIFVHLKAAIRWPETRALVRYLSDFGIGRVQAHSRGAGWCLALSDEADLILLTEQYSDLVDRHELLEIPVLGPEPGDD